MPTNNLHTENISTGDLSTGNRSTGNRSTGNLSAERHHHFRPVSMSKTRLALLYFPLSTPKAARSRLMRWIKQCGILDESLRQSGYHSKQHNFSARQVRLIVEHLDEPEG